MGGVYKHNNRRKSVRRIRRNTSSTSSRERGGTDRYLTDRNPEYLLSLWNSNIVITESLKSRRWKQKLFLTHSHVRHCMPWRGMDICCSPLIPSRNNSPDVTHTTAFLTLKQSKTLRLTKDLENSCFLVKDIPRLLRLLSEISLHAKIKLNLLHMINTTYKYDILHDSFDLRSSKHK